MPDIKAIVKQPNILLTYQKEDKLISNQPNIFLTYQKEDKLISNQPNIFLTYQKEDKLISSQPNIFLTYQKEAENIYFTFNADIARVVNKSFNFNADIERIISTDKPFKFNADIERYIHKSFSFSFDVERDINNSFTFNADIKRIIKNPNEAEFKFNADITRVINKSFNFNADVKIKTPKAIENCCIQSIQITLNEKTLSDTFTLVTANNLNINESICGKLLDFKYNFLVESISQSGVLQSVTGKYDADELLYTCLNYQRPQGNTAVGHAQKIAVGLKKELNICIDDFQTTYDFDGSNTYKNIIPQLFGWTSELPQRQINVFIRGNTLNIIQRGKEKDIIDITNSKHTRPTIQKKMLRVLWAGPSNSNEKTNINSVDIKPMPFNGTISFGDASCSYAGGLLISETHDGERTTYSYSNGYLFKKHTILSDGGTVDTNYTYTSTKNDAFLASEVEETIDKDKNKTVRTTRHVPIGHGWYGTSVEENGEIIGSSVSQGKSGGKASVYSINSSNLSLGGNYSSGGGEVSGATLKNYSFPVIGDMLKVLAKEIEWLDKKTEERISMTIYKLDKIIDFTSQIKYNGNLYYLESNNIRQDTKIFSQNITAVRWY